MLRHEYGEVDPATIWEIVTDHLNPLRDAVVAALKTLERDTS